MAEHDEDFEEAVADVAREGKPEFEPEEAQVFARSLRVLNETGIPYVVGGAFAKHAYTGVWRDTKDLDIFLKPGDLKPALDALKAAGYETEVEFEHWLAKARHAPYFIDLIFGTGHGQLQVDDTWFKYSQPVEIAGVRTRLIPIEELIVSKAYIAERYRFDGADVAHLIRGAKGVIAWSRVLERLGPNRELLLWQLILFDFIYPGHSDYLPKELMVQLFEQARERWSNPQANRKAFRGTLLDPFSFIVDVEDWGYEDRRDLEPLVNDEGEPV
ncbi:MAG: nucleotidyltransferase family protein [Ardenticatenaceae bacterium]|nr:nucleotidyltransferase family protein [Ardenticatenaceae bacterium]HBY93443.1 nucleotidyl transferase [Chloroflexota bacterium]